MSLFILVLWVVYFLRAVFVLTLLPFVFMILILGCYVLVLYLHWCPCFSFFPWDAGSIQLLAMDPTYLLADLNHNRYDSI